MIIKQRSKKTSIYNIFLKLYFFTSIILLLALLAIFLNTGVWINNKKEILHRIYFNGMNNYVNIFQIGTKALTSFFYRYEEINLDIPYENVLLLENNRNQIWDKKNKKLRQGEVQTLSKKTKGMSYSEDGRFIITDATISQGNKKYAVKIRLKGDRPPHYKDKDKSSYKIKITGDNRFKGIRKFSFVKPRMRNYIHEWLFHEFSSEAGLIKLKYEFVYLNINGADQGLYVLEENFDKELIERNKRRNGPIFSIYERFSEDIFNSELEIYNKNFWQKKENIQLANAARTKFKSFLEGKITLEEAFDIEKWASYFAVGDLTYTFHGLSHKNVKFYYNPISGLLEPIPYDGHRGNRNYSKHLINFDDSSVFEMARMCLDTKTTNCFDDKNTTASLNFYDYEKKWLYYFFYKNEKGEINEKFYSKYIEALEKITNENYLNSFFEKRKEDIAKINSAIYSDYFLVDNGVNQKYGPGFYYFSKEDIFHRAQVLKKKIQINLNKIVATDNKNSITIRNRYEPNNLSLIASGLICEIKEDNHSKNFFFDTDLKINLTKVEIKKNSTELSNSKCQYVKLLNKFNNKIYFKEINFNFPVLIGNKNINKKYLDYFYKKDKDLFLIEKRTIVDKDIFIPRGYTVKIKSGDEINLINNAFIISKSRWEVGEDSGEVIIGGNEDNFGGGLVVQSAKGESFFKNTKFKYLAGVEKRVFLDKKLSESSLVLTKYLGRKKNDYVYSTSKFVKENYPYSNEFSFTGAVNFYETNVIFEKCNFYRIDSEDAVNLISSNFIIKNSNFSEISSDSIDVDFGLGKMESINFEDIGNDAVDLSDSKVYLKNLFFLNIGDKAISSGENTDVKIENITAENSYLGIASKDGSITEAKNINFNNVKIPFASYQKKKSYGYGFLKVNDPINLKNYIKKTLKDPNSQILINENEIGNYNNKIITIVYKKNLNLINE